MKIFLDTSVILAGLASKTGGSRKIIDAGKKGKVDLLTTEEVIKETKKHLHKLDLKSKQLENVLSYISIKPTPPGVVSQRFKSITSDPDDAHVLAGAVLSGSDYLVSLDKKHIVTSKVKKSLAPIKIFTPKQFWKEVATS